MSTLLVKPHAQGGIVHDITPRSAGWRYVGFELRDLAPGAAVAQKTGEREICLVLVSGRAAISAGGRDFGTPGGNWSSYPPHKHDSDRLPAESHLEETYYHRLSRPGGFAFQRVYTDDRSIDETMAGPRRTWKFFNDPDHEWMLKR